jgi:hypothetical protein
MTKSKSTTKNQNVRHPAPKANRRAGVELGQGEAEGALPLEASLAVTRKEAGAPAVVRDAEMMAALDATRQTFEGAQRACLGSRRIQELRTLLTRAEAEHEVEQLALDNATERSLALKQLVEVIKSELAR